MCSIPGFPSPGSNVTVLITRVNLNPDCVLVEFWGNFVQDQKLAYQQMKKEIQYPKKVLCEEGEPGDLCLVQVCETWYRARIVSRNDEVYSVFLIDEGRTFQAPVSLLAWGQKDFFNLPPEVEFCILSNVLPLSTEGRWSKLALGFMKSFCGRVVTASVLDFAVSQRAFLLDIPCLSRHIHEMGFAKKLSNEEFKAFVSRATQSNAGSIEPLRSTFMGHKPLEPIKTQLGYLYPQLQAETTEVVLVTEVNNPQRVFCQLMVFSQELKKLMEQITWHYEQTNNSHSARPETLGEPCASRGTDGNWYRSVLLQVLPTSNVVEVLHVDLGKKQVVRADHVRPLAPEFFRMPVVTYVCSLHGVVDQGVGWAVSQIDYLKSLLLNKTLIAKFECQSLSEGLYYVTLYGNKNTNLNKLFALREKCSIDSRDLDYSVDDTETCQRCQMLNKSDAVDLKTVFTESLSPNTDHVAVVQHVDSPSKFWIQTRKYAAEFDILMNGLTELYSDLTRSHGLISKPEAGLMCVAKAKDDVFSRAAICEVFGTKAEVFFLDYGNKELVDCNDLYVLPLWFQNMPALAIKCALYGVRPRTDEWDVKATLLFARSVVDKILDVRIHAKSQDTHLVQVIDSKSDGEKDFSKLLCRAGFAEMEVMDVPVVAPCPKVVKASDVFQTSAVVQSPVLPAATTVFTEYMFPIGSSFDVAVSFIESPNDFWCQKSNDAKCLKLLMLDLQRFYANSEFQPPLEAACVARHPKNGMWSRALVIQKHQASNVTVLFVDYGETKKVPVNDLRRIDPEFLKLKGQAFRCCVYNLSCPVSHSTSVWSPEATLHFCEFVNKAASMSVVLKCTVYAVMCNAQNVLFNIVDLESPFESICKLLVQRGLAGHSPTALPPLRLDTYYYSSHNIKTGSEDDVYVTCVKNVNQFFCHLKRNSAQVYELAAKVNSLCSQQQRINHAKSFENVCFAKYTDGLWYRGQFESKDPLAVVHFVDYGNTQEVEKSDLLPVPFEAAEIMEIPVQAVECGLSDVHGTVPCEVNDWFESFVTDRQLRALIVAKEPSGKLIVELYEGKTPVNAMIREKIPIKCEQNEQITEKVLDIQDPYRSYGMPGRWKVPQCTTEKHWRSWRRAESERTGKILDWDMKQDITAIHTACHGESPSKSRTTEPSVHKHAELPVKVVEPGLKAEVLVSHCSSPLSFSVQLVTDENDIWSLVEKMNDGQSKHVPVNPVDLCESDLVSALYPDDNRWYRAVVRKAPVGDVADVEFIDFGNTAEVLVSKICILDEKFSQPGYSIHCSLAGVGLNVDDDVTSNFKTEIEKNADPCLCTFIQQSGSVWEVNLEVNGELLGSALFEDTNVKTVTGAPKSPDTDFNLCTCKNPDLLTGQVIAVYASVIIGPQLFWCQYAETEKLHEISDVVQKAGGNMESDALTAETLPVGSGCIALFNEDHLWYRALVTSGEKDMLSVLFVDYGNESKVKMSVVKPMPLEVSDLPPQAFACQLDGFSVLDGSWDNKADDQFFELINDQLLKVTVLKLAASSDMATHFVKLESEGLNINDEMKKWWIQNGNKTSVEDAVHATVLDSSTVSETSFPCEPEPVVSPEKDPFLGVEKYDYVPNDNCISPLQLQEECNCALAVREERAGAPQLLHKDVDVSERFSQEDHHDLVTAGPGEPKSCSKTVCVSDVNLNVPDVHPVQSADVPSECLLASADLLSKDAFTASLENTDKNQVGTVDMDGESSEGHTSGDEVCEVSEDKRTDYDIIKSDLGNIRRAAESGAVRSKSVIWSYVHKNLGRAQKISEDCTLGLLLDHDCVRIVDQGNIFEIVPERSSQAVTQVEHEAATCLSSRDRPDAPKSLWSKVLDHDEEMDEEPGAGTDVVVCEKQLFLETRGRDHDLESEKPQQVDADQDLNASQIQMFFEDVLAEQSVPAMEMGPKLQLEQNASGTVTVEALSDPPAQEPRASGPVSDPEGELMGFLPEVPLEKNQEAESDAGTDLATFGVESPEKAQEKHDSCDLVTESEKPDLDDATRGPDLPLDDRQEMIKGFADVSSEPSEPAEEVSPTVEVVQDLRCAVKVQVQTVRAAEGPSAAGEEPGGPATEPEDELIEFMSVAAPDEDQEAESEAEMDSQEKAPAVELEADPDLVAVFEVIGDGGVDSVSETETGSDTASGTMEVGMLEAGRSHAGAAPSDSSDAEELGALTLALQSLGIEDSPDDDVVFVKAWKLSPSEASGPGSEE